MAAVPFPERFKAVRTLLAVQPETAFDIPERVREQVVAQSQQANDLAHLVAHELNVLEPGDRRWRYKEREADLDSRALLVAAMLDPRLRLCPHLRREPEQMGVVRLALHRIDCQRCVATLVQPPEEDDDVCDVCGARGVSTFWPVMVQIGPLLVVGDACSSCRSVMRLGEAA